MKVEDKFFVGNENEELLKDSIIYNCTATVEAYEPVGNATEVGLLNYLAAKNMDISNLIDMKQGHIKAVMPFNSDAKMSAVAVEQPNKNGKVVIYLKGAPEYILSLSSNGLDGDDIDRDAFDKNVDNMAKKPLRVIGFAYIELNRQQW